MNNFSKSSPEFSFYHKVRAFFEDDPDIHVGDIDEDEYEFTITVDDVRKYRTLQALLCIPDSRLTVNIRLSDGGQIGASDEDLAYLLSGNKYFAKYMKGSRIYRSRHAKEDYVNGLIPSAMNYILMKPVVVQYYDDIFNNPAGVDTKTAEALAKELFHGSHCNISSNTLPLEF